MKILVFGAHPDDCDIFAGGTAALWRRRGDNVRFVSVTNGNAGHFSMRPDELAARRRAEAERAGAVIGIEYEVLDNDDGKLEPTLERRFDMIRRIRAFSPDLILTHRPDDYHPDHRYTSVLVRDSAYMVTVPLICPETPHLARNPVIAYLHDEFTKPRAFEPEVVVPVDAVMELKWEMLHAHESQFYEWLPFNDGTAAEVPAREEARRDWLRRRWSPFLERVAVRHRDALIRWNGDGIGSVRHAEAFEIGEHGSRPSDAELRRMFPSGSV